MEKKLTKVTTHLFATYNGQTDIFAFESDTHNGPRCVKCGRDFCHHCSPDCYIEDCVIPHYVDEDGKAYIEVETESPKDFD